MDRVLRMGDRDVGRDVFEFGILGPLTASRGGDQLSLGSPQQRATLAVLVCHVGRIVPRERLVDSLWGDAPSPAVVTSIRAHVSHLRQVLEPSRGEGEAYSVLVTESSGYRLAVPETAVDAQRFARLVAAAQSSLEAGEPGAALGSFSAALSLWRGDVLVDLRRYPFVDVVATRLEELRIAAEEGRIQAYLDLGHDAKALTEADRLLAEHPLREGLAAQRMLALYRVGRQSDALATYRDLRVRLDTELGIEPNRSLQRLEQRILLQDPNLQSERREPEPPAPASRPAPASTATDDPGASPHGSADAPPPLRRQTTKVAGTTAGPGACGLWPREPRPRRVASSARAAAHGVGELGGSHGLRGTPARPGRRRHEPNCPELGGRRRLGRQPER